MERVTRKEGSAGDEYPATSSGVELGDGGATARPLDDEKLGKYDTEYGIKEVSSAEEDSPYPEVRAAVAPWDYDVPVNTFRAWSLGIFWTIILCGVNQFFAAHNPPLSLSTFLVILISLPMGHFLARVLPTKSWTVFGQSFTLNPGPFNQKEHTLIAILCIAPTGFNSGMLATFVWTAMVKYFHIPVSAGYRFMFLFTTQSLSLGLSYMFGKILVEPSYCIWPSALPTCTLLTSMHDKKFQEKVANGWSMNRMKFFWIMLAATAAYQFLPGYIFTGLSTFAFVTWIAPNNVVVNQVFGSTTGMDLIPLTFDWNVITGYLGSPLVVPGWALVNTLCGCIFFLWILSPALHWSNVWGGLYTPFSSSSVFDNTGSEYNISRVMNPDYSLNEEAYHAYSPIYMSTTTILSYGLGLGCMTSIIVHTWLYHGKEVWTGLKASFSRKKQEVDETDIHIKLMRRYSTVPMWWSVAVFVVIFALTILFVEYFNTGLPWWGVILSLAINLVLLVPIAIMSAICNISVNPNVLASVIGGFIWAGKMIPVVVFKTLTSSIMGNAMVILRDMKMGNYMKIPPRTVFIAQSVGILVSCVVQTGVNVWMLANVDGICTSKATGGMSCPIPRSYEASITFWGLIGPGKLFSPGSMYNSMLYFFLIGAGLPVILFYAERFFPHGIFKKIHIPLIMASISAIPPATAANFIPWALLGVGFNYFLKKYRRGWWSKYNYILSAALDAGLAITTFLIFFCLYYPGVSFDWWGNVFPYTTADAAGLPLKMVAEGEHFGPDSWK